MKTIVEEIQKVMNKRKSINDTRGMSLPIRAKLIADEMLKASK